MNLGNITTISLYQSTIIFQCVMKFTASALSEAETKMPCLALSGGHDYSDDLKINLTKKQQILKKLS